MPTGAIKALHQHTPSAPAIPSSNISEPRHTISPSSPNSRDHNRPEQQTTTAPATSSVTAYGGPSGTSHPRPTVPGPQGSTRVQVIAFFAGSGIPTSNVCLHVSKPTGLQGTTREMVRPPSTGDLKRCRQPCRPRQSRTQRRGFAARIDAACRGRWIDVVCLHIAASLYSTSITLAPSARGLPNPSHARAHLQRGRLAPRAARVARHTAFRCPARPAMRVLDVSRSRGAGAWRRHHHLRERQRAASEMRFPTPSGMGIVVLPPQFRARPLCHAPSDCCPVRRRCRRHHDCHFFARAPCSPCMVERRCPVSRAAWISTLRSAAGIVAVNESPRRGYGLASHRMACGQLGRLAGWRGSDMLWSSDPSASRGTSPRTFAHQCIIYRPAGQVGCPFRKASTRACPTPTGRVIRGSR